MKKSRKENALLPLVPAEGAGLLQKAGVPGIIFGMLCRFAVAVCGAFGVCLMLENAFSLAGGEHPVMRTLLMCVAVTAVLYLLFLSANTNKAFFITAVSVTAILTVVTVFFRIGAREFFVDAPVTMWNHVLMKLGEYGYTSLGWLSVSGARFDPRSVGAPDDVRLVFTVISVPVCLAFTAGTFRKPRVVPAIIASGIVMTLTFTYNLLTESFGFLCVIAAGFGLLVLRYLASFTSGLKKKERGFDARRKSLAQTARSGFSALTAAALIFGVGAYPAARINEPAPELTIFNDFMDRAREFVYRYISNDEGGGTGPTLVDPDSLNQSINPTPRTFNNRTVMTVRAAAPQSLYLRSWIGEKYTGDNWERASGSTGFFRDDFIPEDITELFYTIVDSGCNTLPSLSEADAATAERGFVKESVTVKSDALKSRRAYTPSRFSHIYGIRSDKPYSFVTAVGTMLLDMEGAEYTSVAYAQTYKNVSLSRLDRDMRIYRLIYPRLRSYIEENLYTSDNTDAPLLGWKDQIAELEEEALAQGLRISGGSVIYRLAGMSFSEADSLLRRMSDAEVYEAQVFNTLTDIPWSDEGLLRGLALQTEERVSDIEADRYMPSWIYSFADRTARYLAETCDYSTRPTGYTDHGGSYLSQFLTTAKNGYCMQYATAGALILRAAGIPTRFAEGFVAPSFTRSGGEYVCRVKDSNAHAWIEAYVQGYGWMTFEMTGPMMSGIYPSRSPVLDPDETDPAPVTPPVDETTAPGPDDETTAPVTTQPSPVTTDPGETTDPGPGPTPVGRNLIPVIVAAVAVVALCTAVYVYLHRVVKRKKKLDSLLKRSAAGRSSAPLRDTGTIAEYIRLLFGMIGVRRRENELMSDFVTRVNGLTGDKADFSRAADAIQKAAFGRASEPEDSAEAGKYAIFLRGFVKEKLTGMRKFYYVSLRKLL